MLSLSLAALGLVTIGAYANPTPHAAHSLEVHLSTPAHNVASASDVRLLVTVKNTGKEPLKIFRLGTVLDHEHRTRPFKVTKDGKEVPFTGVAVPTSTGYLPDDRWIIIDAGLNVTAEHDAVSGLYDFSASGPGTFTFRPVPTFQVTGLDNATRAETVKAHPIDVTITDVSKRELGLRENGPIDCNTEERTAAISGSLLEAGIIAGRAIRYIEEHVINSTVRNDLFYQYFGILKPAVIIDNFRTVGKVNFELTSLTCTNNNGCSNQRATFFESINDVIYYCDPFFEQLPIQSVCQGTGLSGGTIRGGTTLRMIIAKDGYSVSDYESPCTPGVKGGNGRNSGDYECFALQLYRDAGCTIGIE